MKKRIIPSLLLSGGATNVCLSQQFSPWRTVGTLAQQLKLHVSRQCDELLVVNINKNKLADFALPPRLPQLISRNVDIPISYAGGIRTAQSASQCINQSFDKVFLTSSFIQDPSELISISSVLGVQSVGVSLPYRFDLVSRKRFVWDYATGSLLKDKTLVDSILMAVDCGAGEIYLHSVDRDGSLEGLDEEILSLLQELQLSVPCLLGGGAGSPAHFSSVLSSEFVQGVVASSIFSLTEETPATIRDYCLMQGIPMRRV